MADASGSTKVAFWTEPEKGGFWLALRTNSPVKFGVRYVAIGGAGYERHGELSGSCNGSGHLRLFVELDFDVSVAGIVEASWSGLSPRPARIRAMSYHCSVWRDSW